MSQAPVSSKKKMPVYGFTYAGKASELFKMWLVNLLLTIPTIGIYRFWAKAKIRKYQASHLKLAGAFFEHTGTGKELFIGFLKVVAILLGLFMIPIVAELTGLSFLLFGFYILFYVGLFYFLAIAQYASLRYMASRTTWRGIRGHLGGSMIKYANFAIWRTILNFVSLGLLKPKSDILKHKYQMDNLQFGSQKFEFKGNAKGLMKPYLLQYILLVPVLLGLVIGGIYKGKELIDNAQGAVISSNIEFQEIMLDDLEDRVDQGTLHMAKAELESLRIDIETAEQMIDSAEKDGKKDFSQERRTLEVNTKRLERLERILSQRHGAVKNKNPLLHFANAQSNAQEDGYQPLTDEEIDSILNDDNSEETFNDIVDNIEESGKHAGAIGFVFGYIVIFYIILPILFLLLIAPYQVALMRKKFGGLALGEIRFKSKVTAKKYIGLFIGNAFITIFTLGFGRAIVWRRNMMFFADNTILGGDLKAFTAKQIEKQKASAGEGLVDALDMDMGFDIGL
ncbi:MAG: YjgN family protein [Bdellovibrionales bacterium]